MTNVQMLPWESMICAFVVVTSVPFGDSVGVGTGVGVGVGTGCGAGVGCGAGTGGAAGIGNGCGAIDEPPPLIVCGPWLRTIFSFGTILLRSLRICAMIWLLSKLGVAKKLIC